ncbi:MAG TPA: TonB-dependent receptor [Vicinamibacterales bacterium]|nr:TonB-dependent receptor [Vicinamibacterales bacterium]
MAGANSQSARLIGMAVRGWLVLAAGMGAPEVAFSQTTATLTGIVVDQQGAALPGAELRIVNVITGLEQTTITGSDGSFLLTNIPPRQYRLTVTFPGFETDVRDIDLRTSVPVSIEIVLRIAAQRDTVTVSASTAPLVDATLTGTRTAVSAMMIQQMPTATGSRGLESVLVTFPGFAQNANGAIHPRGAHNQMTFVVDGLPISDQLTGAFANGLDSTMVQSVELMTGNIPAEFGAKISGVAVVTTRSGLGLDRRLTGDTALRVGQFNTVQSATQAGGQQGRFGYFGTMTAMRTDRFLDQVSLDNLHNRGHFGRAFGRIDALVGPSDLLRAHAMGGRSWFQLANLRSQQANGQDQRQILADWSVWAAHLRTIDDRSTLESMAGLRTTTARLLPSPGDIPVTASQDRALSTMTLSTRYTRIGARHSVRAGADLQRFPVREAFTLGITSPDFNDPASGHFNPALLAHDLTRGGQLFTFDDRRTGLLASGFVQDSIRWQRLTATLGLRFDEYRFLVTGRQLQPRVGVAWAIPGLDMALRASYNRNYQTPPNENLLLSSSEAASRLAPQSVRDALGGAFVPIRPERQDVVEVGLQYALLGAMSLDVSAYRKWARDQQDNNNFFDTGIIFPTTLKALRAYGVEARLTVPRTRGASGTLSVTTSRAVSTPPFTGGLFLGQDAVDLLSAGPFVIDHDQAVSVHGTVNYNTARGVWFGGSIRYDSGLVANPSDPAEVAADPDFYDLLPYVDLEAEVPRVRPRTIIDAVVGYDAMRRGQRNWSVRLQINNVTNRIALYNFQSVFVGTRVVPPRTVSTEFRYYW